MKPKTPQRKRPKQPLAEMPLPKLKPGTVARFFKRMYPNGIPKWVEPGATEGPWHVHNRGIGYEIHGPAGCEINGNLRETFTKADAELIVRAVNALRGHKTPPST